MKCRECPDYTKCVKESNLAIKRKNCPKAKTEKVKTNADRIRAMSDEEMATDLLDMFEEICEDGVPCKEWMLGWLKQPAEGE